MMRNALLAAAALLLTGMAPTYQPGKEVDVILVLMADVSGSMDAQDKAIQRQGYAAAFRDAAVLNAIQDGGVGCILVSYHEWAERQETIVPWTRVCDDEQAEAFAAAIENAKPAFVGIQTYMGDAILFGGAQIAAAKADGWSALRYVVDMSADGKSNGGQAPALARDEVAAKGIGINGLPILSGTSETGLREYFETQVMGGPAAFTLPANSIEELPAVVAQKLRQEIG